MPHRRIQHRYEDPLSLVWIATAKRLGVRVVRSDDVYASWDGAGTLKLSTREHFDQDDSLAQMIFHELCHALIAGPSAHGRVDWGLSNADTRDLVQEHACHRLQAALADRYELRAFFAVTTEWRPYWDSLPTNPLDPTASPDDPAVALAQLGYERAHEEPWATALADALSATTSIAAAVHPFAEGDSLWVAVERPRK